MAATPDAITDEDYWNRYWEKVRLPREIRRDPDNPYVNAILDVLDRHLPVDARATALEIGGAPGQYLAYVHRRFGYRVSALDYSPKGCEVTERNLALLGIDGQVYQRDLFGDLGGIPAFDVVYSLGFIEHFMDTRGVVARHVELLKPGGLLVLGVPSLLGINHFFLRRVAPQMLATHNCDSMRLDRWNEFSSALRLERLFLDYVGGFEPSIFCRLEHASASGRFWYRVARVLHRVLAGRWRALHGVNHRFWSGYAMGVFRKPDLHGGA